MVPICRKKTVGTETPDGEGQLWEAEGPERVADEVDALKMQGRLTMRSMDLLSSAPDGIVDLNEAARVLGARKRRVYDVTNVLDGIQLIKKRSTSQIQWVGSVPVNELSGQWKEKLREELLDLSAMEEALDELIRDCAQQLYFLTDLKENAEYPSTSPQLYICGIEAFQEQVVIAIKAPEETRLEVPAPKEDGIQIHLKGTRGPITVLTCETEGQDSGKAAGGSFSTLEDSRIPTAPLLKDKSTVQPSGKSP
ncbi:hypothetical protein AAFF_G00222750 [Aldrovandia affinis]|uniref:E2F/DP family winged-helix DNA-binding domain-containing protein n=1 Tax=Aldrovandia affinis TaxID=143900 RepID=A0AAD7W4A8_9TELE|nr:hypothetical protein AAFF_G00222750 [Aldrovandia affinis]